MIESAVTDLPLPDSPTTPSVPPFAIEKSTPSTARIRPPWVWNPVRRFLTREQLAHGFAFRAASVARGFAAVPFAPFAGAATLAGTGTAMCFSSCASITLGVARLQSGQQVAVLVDHALQVLAAAVAEEVGTDPGPDGAPDLHGVGLAGGRDHDLVEAEVGLDVPGEIVRGGGLLHQPDLLAELGELLLGDPVERVHEAVALEGEPDRDQDLLHLLVRDAEDDGAAIRERHHEALVLELAQCLADRAAARAELRRQRRLDQALARLVGAHDDRAAQDLDHLLASRPALAGASVEDYRGCAIDATGHPCIASYKLSTINRWLTIPHVGPSVATLR